MSAKTIHIRLKINFPVILFTVLSLHLLLFMSNQLPELKKLVKQEPPTTLNIRRIKTSGVKEGLLKTDLFLPTKTSGLSDKKEPSSQKSPLSFKDLSIAQPSQVTPAKVERPGTRPGVMPTRPKALNKISLNGKEFKEFSKAHAAGGYAATRQNMGGAGINDAVVSLEVPEGVEPDELNKYELMFYSFQRRTALNYAGSIIKNLNKFGRENPLYKIDPHTNITMTARLTYDDKGNVKQIKMIRWTNVDKIQNFFEDVVKGIDQLHNPPKALWEKSGEFSMFFTLEING